MKKLAITFPVIAGACWGCFGIFIRILYRAGFDNITITFSRGAMMIILLGIYMLFHDRELFRIRMRDLPLLTGLGLVGYFCLNITYNITVHTLSLSLASVLLSTAPVFVIIFGTLLFHERITGIRILCMLGALLGCMLLSGVFEPGGIRWDPFGLLMGVLSSACNAFYIIGIKEATDRRKIHPLTAVFYPCLIAVILMIPFADLHVLSGFLAEKPITRILFLLGYAMIASLLPNLLFTTSFRYVDAGVVSILESGTEPTSALIAGMLIYHEFTSVYGLAGIAMTVAALIVLSVTDAKKRE